MSAALELVLVANTRLPSERAQALQVVQAAAAFARAGVATTIVHAKRRREIALAPGTDVFAHYQVPAGPRPSLARVECTDWIESFPRALQFWPARLQELTFSRNAAQLVLREHRNAAVLSREVECARELTGAGHANVFLEIHRVPGGGTRRRWLLEASRKARGIVAISGGVREDLVALGVAGESVLVAHDGFEASRFAALPSRSEARASLGIDANARVAVYTGGLMEWKGVEGLVEAARALPDVLVVIAGGAAEDVEGLRNRARGIPNVRIDGFQPPERVALYLAAADAGVAPNRSKPEISARYTSPLKIFESMAAGLPLVASDLPAMRELLTHDVDAWLVAPDDSDALARGLRELLDDPARRARLAQRFRSRSAEHTWDARAAAVLAWMRARLARA